MNQAAYIKGYMDKMAKSATVASPLAQGILANPYLRSMLLGGLVGGGINMYRNWDDEDQSLGKSFLRGAVPGAAIGAGLQYALPNDKKFTRLHVPGRIDAAPSDTAAMQRQMQMQQSVPQVDPSYQWPYSNVA